jgi:hypothetical protein
MRGRRAPASSGRRAWLPACGGSAGASLRYTPWLCVRSFGLASCRPGSPRIPRVQALRPAITACELCSDCSLPINQHTRSKPLRFHNCQGTAFSCTNVPVIALGRPSGNFIDHAPLPVGPVGVEFSHCSPGNPARSASQHTWLPPAASGWMCTAVAYSVPANRLSRRVLAPQLIEDARFRPLLQLPARSWI